MAAQDQKAIIRDYFAACNRDWEGAIERYVSDAELAEHIRFFQKALPGYRLEAHDMLSDGDRVAVRATVSGVHGGELGGVAPTGRDVAIPLFIIYRLDGGHIVEHWMLADQAGLMAQITSEASEVTA